jgi:hypothetical protein
MQKGEVERDPLVGDSEVTAIGFHPDQLTMTLENRNVRKRARVFFDGVVFYHLAGAGPIVLDHIEQIGTIEEALQIKGMASVLLNRDLIDHMQFELICRPEFKIFRLIVLAGFESFVVCSVVSIDGWYAANDR